MDSTNEPAQPTPEPHPEEIEDLEELIAELEDMDPAAAAEPAALIAKRLSQALDGEDR